MQLRVFLFRLQSLLTNLSNKEISVLELCEQEWDPSWQKFEILSENSTFYLPDGHAAHTRVQHACPGTGTHLAGEREPFPPSDTVGLHRLPVRANQQPILKLCLRNLNTDEFGTNVIPRVVRESFFVAVFITNNITSPPDSGLSPLWKSLQIFYCVREFKLYKWAVSPIGAWDRWVGPVRLFQSRPRRPELCWLRNDLPEEMQPARSASSLSLLVKPISTEPGDPTIEINVQLRKPRERKRIPHNTMLNGGPARCKRLKTGKTTGDRRWG